MEGKNMNPLLYGLMILDAGLAIAEHAGLSLENAVELIRSARAEGRQVTMDDVRSKVEERRRAEDDRRAALGRLEAAIAAAEHGVGG